MKREIMDKLERLRACVKILKEYKKRSKKDLKNNHTLKAAVERYLQIALECVIEIGEMIIAEEGFKNPETLQRGNRDFGKGRCTFKGICSAFCFCCEFPKCSCPSIR